MSNDLGVDRSGNQNDFVVNNLSYADQMLDVPTNNFATLNPLDQLGTLSEGNLKGTPTSSKKQLGTFGASTGKWYWEFYIGGSSTLMGVADLTNCNIHNSNHLGSTAYGWGYYTNSKKYNNNTASDYGATLTTGDIVGVAVDLDGGTVTFYKNSVSQGQAYDNLTTGGAFCPANSNGSSAILNTGQDSSFAGNKTAQGNQDGNGIGDFAYAPPSGFLALCTKNLPEPTVDPRNHFNTVTYTGTGLANNPQTVGFQPDFVWFKSRSASRAHVLVDAVRGVTKELVTNTTNAEQTSEADEDLTAFTSTGFDLGTVYNNSPNESGASIVAWNWKAGNANTAFSESGNNPAGTHRANVAAGFSIVSYVGTGAAGTVAHGLGVAPELMIIKNRDVADEWYVYYGDNTDYLVLDDTDATADNATAWNDTSPSSTVFTVNTSHSVNADAENYIAYCWRSIEGFSKVGSYTGNGSADGAFIYTGFRPAWVMIKRTDATNYWLILDDTRRTFNPNFTSLYPNLSNAEDNFGNGTGIDFVSSGFKHRDSAASTNADGGNYIYLAFADSPFKYSNGK